MEDMSDVSSYLVFCVVLLLCVVCARNDDVVVEAMNGNERHETNGKIVLHQKTASEEERNIANITKRVA